MLLYDKRQDGVICAAPLWSVQTTTDFNGHRIIQFGVSHPWFYNYGVAETDEEADYHSYRRYLERLFGVQVVEGGYDGRMLWSVTCQTYAQLVFLITLIRHPVELKQQRPDYLAKHYPMMFKRMGELGCGAFGALTSAMADPVGNLESAIRKWEASRNCWKQPAGQRGAGSFYGAYDYYRPKVGHPWDTSCGHGLFECKFWLWINRRTDYHNLDDWTAWQGLAKSHRTIGSEFAKGNFHGYKGDPIETQAS